MLRDVHHRVGRRPRPPRPRSRLDRRRSRRRRPGPSWSASSPTSRPVGTSDDLADRFAGTLEFGTAGLRGALGAGPNRMNRVVVAARRGRPGGVPPRAGGAAGQPGRHRLRRPLQLRRLRPRHRRGDERRRVLAAAAPAAAADAAARVRDPRARLRGGRDGDRQPQPAAGQRLQGLPRRRQPDRAAGRQRHRRRRSPPWARSPTSRAATRGTVLGDDDRRPLPRHRRPSSPPTAPATCAPSTPRCTASAAPRCCRCSRPPASTRPRSSSSRRSPTPPFPTVAFPNPEEPGAMDLAMALAERTGADLVVANDPDADRCAAAVPGPHGWRMLRGDEVGALLGPPPARRTASRARTPPRSCRRRCSASWRPPTASRTPRR